MIRRVGALLAVPAALGGVLTVAGPAAAVDGCDGVLVVVETRSVPDSPGYGVRTGCAADPDSGIQALQQAGFTVRLGTGPYAGGFVCALDGAPKAGCGAVTNDRSWKYWYMLPGTDTWVSSEIGAGNRTPPKGSIEGWVWQDGASRPPSPRSAKAPAPAPATPAPPPATDRASAPAGGSRTGSSAPAPQPEDSTPAAESATPSAEQTTPQSSSGTPQSSTPEPGSPSAPSAPSPSPTALRPQAVETRPARSWWPMAAGAAAVAALVGATLWRRRQRELP